MTLARSRQPLVGESVYTTLGVAFLRRGAQKRVGWGAVTPMGIYAIRMALGCLADVVYSWQP